MLSQRLVDELAELRDGTTILSNDPPKVALIRRRHRPFAPGATLLWPPCYTQEPLIYDIYANRYVESTSPLSSLTSETHYDVEESNPRIATNGQELLHSSPTNHHLYFGSPYQGHPPAALDCDVISEQRLLNSEPKTQSKSKYISHIIGEDDFFNPFSYNISCDDEGDVRGIDTVHGIIFAPAPRIPTAAALVNFEIIAHTAMVQAPENVFEKAAGYPKFSKPAKSEWPHLGHSSKEEPRPWTVFVEEDEDQISTAPSHQSASEQGDVTGPHTDFLANMITLLYMRPGPFKDEMMKQFWMWSELGATSSGPLTRRLSMRCLFP
ncbi:hypothetical protein C0991_012486 [Blastosporella zonata]|nr:hypothetical protein C0991_012486 [Blastosporella zonata]